MQKAVSSLLSASFPPLLPPLGRSQHRLYPIYALCMPTKAKWSHRALSLAQTPPIHDWDGLKVQSRGFIKKPTPPLISCVTLGKSVHLSDLNHLIYVLGIVMELPGGIIVFITIMIMIIKFIILIIIKIIMFNNNPTRQYQKYFLSNE